jgi:transposase
MPLIRLPPCSPELNPAERVFQEVRRAIEGKVYTTLEDKMKAVAEFLRSWRRSRSGTLPHLVGLDQGCHPATLLQLCGYAA